MEDDFPRERYEIAFLASTPLGEEACLTALARHGAEVVHRVNASPIKLAYPIRRVESALFGVVTFRAAPASVRSLREALALESLLFRFLIVRASEPRGKRAGAAPPRPTADAPAAPPSALTNEALEAKIEEILK